MRFNRGLWTRSTASDGEPRRLRNHAMARGGLAWRTVGRDAPAVTDVSFVSPLWDRSSPEQVCGQPADGGQGASS